jgi:NTE family protein
MDVDIERVRKMNSLVAMMPETLRERANLKHVDVLVISPSQSIDDIAERYAGELPWTIRLLLRLIGARQHSHSGTTLVSYLLSEKKYCSALIELGYQDAMKRREEIMKFFDLPHQREEMPQ